MALSAVSGANGSDAPMTGASSSYFTGKKTTEVRFHVASHNLDHLGYNSVPELLISLRV